MARKRTPKKVYEITLHRVVLTEKEGNQLGANRQGTPVFPESYSDAMKQLSDLSAEHFAWRKYLMEEIDRNQERWRKRNRKSNPETIRRNADLCRKRMHDRKRWSLKALQKHFKLGSLRAVTRILSERTKWLYLDRQLRGDQNGTN